MEIKSFKDLEIWKRSIELVVQIYAETKAFPRDEIYGLTNQLRRAIVSVPSNISEGFARYHNKEYRQFLYVALGSCAEVTTQITISYRLGYLDKTVADKILNEVDEISRMIMSLIKKLQAKYSLSPN